MHVSLLSCATLPRRTCALQFTACRPVLFHHPSRHPASAFSATPRQPYSAHCGAGASKAAWMPPFGNTHLLAHIMPCISHVLNHCEGGTVTPRITPLRRRTCAQNSKTEDDRDTVLFKNDCHRAFPFTERHLTQLTARDCSSPFICSQIFSTFVICCSLGSS
jgi:hypothetical protein